MSKINLSDLNLLLTDKIMIDIYNSSIINLSNCDIIDYNDIFSFNLHTNPKKILNLSSKLKDHFYLIAGSSNFHHLDISNLIRLKNKLKKKMQLILFDSHMDALRYIPESNFIHCGNWVSYLYNDKIINKVVTIGTGDWRKNKGFDYSLINNNDLLYHPDCNKPLKIEFLDPNIPTYISIDTDILDCPSDWGIGRCKFDEVLTSPIWDQLSNFNIVGATIMGHVTDNRKTLDLVKSFIQTPSKSNKYYRKEISAFFKNSIKLKLFASLTAWSLSIDKQFEIISKFYQRVQSIR